MQKNNVLRMSVCSLFYSTKWYHMAPPTASARVGWVSQWKDWIRDWETAVITDIFRFETCGI